MIYWDNIVIMFYLLDWKLILNFLLIAVEQYSTGLLNNGYTICNDF